MRDLFAQARERVSAEEAARFYGLEFDRRGWALCPFHPDKHPSMSFRNGRFTCWACQAKGSSVDFVARHFGLDHMGALRRLNEDFSLGLPLDRAATREEKQAAAKHRERDQLHAQFEQWRQDTIQALTDCIRHANRLDLADMEHFTDVDVLALRYREPCTHWADALSGTAAEQMAAWRERKELKALTDRILKPTPRK